MYGLFIQLEEKIQVQRSSFVVDEITLTTRVGGIIGVGKEMFWIIIFTFGIMKLAFSMMVKRDKKVLKALS